MTTTNNRLPENWCVFNKDCSQRFKDTVIAYINENKNNSNFTWTGCDRDRYYGFMNGKVTESRDIFGTLLSIDEFVELLNPSPRFGERVEVSDNKVIWHKCIYLTTIPQSLYPYCVVRPIDFDETAFKNNEKIHPIYYKYMREIKSERIIELTTNEVFDILAKNMGVNKSKIKIIDNK